VIVPIETRFDAVVIADCVALVTVPAVVAVVAFPVSAAVIVPAVKFPLESRRTIVLPVLALVALDVTVNVPPSEETLPDIPLPLVAPAAT
tara:strand:- start:771 stop:1040 length:270 start_codon:yes stop_codon:yes gene_type:complete